MAYCRWSDGDLYVFELMDSGHFMCMACPLLRAEQAVTKDHVVQTRHEMILHLRRHIDAGHDVNLEAIERFQEEIDAGLR